MNQSQTHLPAESKRAPNPAAALLTRAAAWLKRYPAALPLILLVIYLGSVLAVSAAKPLWHDELFTFYIAGAPTLRQSLQTLNSLDLNPPLVYLLTRLSFHLFGINTLATRLPEIAFFLVATAALYRFVLRRMGAVFAAFAASLLLLSRTFELAAEARPYTLLIGFIALALVGWQEAAAEPAAPHRTRGLILLSLSIAGALASHLFALPAILVLLAAETHRRAHRGWDRPVLAAILLPCVVAVVDIPMFRTHATGIYPPSFVPDGSTVFDFYIGAIERELIALGLTGLAVLFTLGANHLRAGGAVPSVEGESIPRTEAWFFTPAEWVAILGLCFLPLLLMFYLFATSAPFFTRYGAIGSLGIAILATALLGRWTLLRTRQPDPRAALLGLLIVLLISGQLVRATGELVSGRAFHSFAAQEPIPKPCDACGRTAAPLPGEGVLPLVDASGLTFVEMNHNESPALTARLFYLTDPQASTSIAHANIFERMNEEVDRFHLRGHTEPYQDFIRDHPHFYVLGKYDWPEDWLLKKLVADGAEVRVLGRTQDDYRDKELYEVRIPPH